ncbi:TIGR00730 family Rossman fold protein [Desulfoluna butyratoxydans]|uniref:Cytokinin riboside 5'-monophosphate phosphoribohydrolase n=1 Tax=Desulfoluna butyratoxydans TaxID=231438 RepID=A0A4U8YMR5_9BACT|nr:TIGR00730 family Rossman fold protein [Desulfoluna butyratoxydans]VFQ44827.1 cytokinin riboside 5'-monophosphate phosphoribohydrolase log [Desulfoluna butyratoxydans]
MKNICVFCGASPGSNPAYLEGARELGKTMAANDIRLVYGGGSLGMMGTLAKTVKEYGGKVTGVITRHLVDMEVALTDLDDLRVVDTMHERKGLMAELSDGFIALPGGFGTMEEIFEIITWSQLGIHKKPCGFLNVDTYYDKLMAFFNHMADQSFIEADYSNIVLMDEKPDGLISRLRAFTPVESDKGKWAKELTANSHA